MNARYGGNIIEVGMEAKQEDEPSYSSTTEERGKAAKEDEKDEAKSRLSCPKA